ncbi:MAG: hypothetical protein IKY67_09510 [Paludibacteraceae bacterium]|nr:hypothetical protein [Paludibacteraceae bacterium]
MSLLDIEGTEKRVDEYLVKLQKDKESWAKFQAEVIMPRVKKLKQRKPIRDFAVGVYMPKDFLFGLGQSLDSLSDAEKVVFYHLDCRSVTSLSSAMGYLTTISRDPYSVILLEHFDEIPDSPEKKYIENILIHIWERDFMMHRNNFFVLFSTSKDYGDQTPDILKKIKSLDWCGSIYK